MLTEPLTLTHSVISLAFIIGGLIIGIIIEKIILVKLKKFAERTSWEGDEVIIASIRGVAILWCGIGGIYSAVLNLPIKPSILGIFQKILVIVVICRPCESPQ
jgi:hypothetical protein